MAGPSSLEDIGYADLPEIGNSGGNVPSAPSSVQDLGYDVIGGESGKKYAEPSQADPYAQEIEGAKSIMRQKGMIGPSTGQVISGMAGKAGEAIKYAAPTALGGEGKFGWRDIGSAIVNAPGAIYEAGKEAFMAPGRLASGEVPMFDVYGTPTEAGIAEGLKFTAVGPAGVATRGALSIPETVARRRISEAIRGDIESGTVRGLDPYKRNQFGPRALPGATPSELQSVISSGVPVSGYDIAPGPKVKSLVESSAEKAPSKAGAVSLAQDIAERAKNTGTYISGTVDKIAGKPIATGEEFDAAVKAINATNQPAYTSVMQMPEHQSIFSPTLKTILEERPVFSRILRERAKGAQDRGEASPPIFDRRGGIDIQPYNSPSLEYLDEVYRSVRDKATKAYEDGDSTTGKDYKMAAEALRSELDKLSAKNPAGEPFYKAIRDDASEVFGAKNALEAGYKFTRAADPLKINEITTAYTKYSPNQKEQFRIGLLANIKDEALKGNASKVTSWFDGSNPQMYSKIEKILGNDDAARLGNQIRIQKILNETPAPVVPQNAPVVSSRGISIPNAAGLGAGALVVGEKVLENMPQVAQVLQTPLTQGTAIGFGVAATAFTGKKLIRAAKNAYEARVSQDVIDAITTRDPKKIEKLESYPPSVLKIILDRATNLGMRGAVSEAGQAEKPNEEKFVFKPAEQNAGGRIGRKSGGRATGNPISAEVRRVRALLSEKTASMLSIPDDAIATALHIAKRT